MVLLLRRSISAIGICAILFGGCQAIRPAWLYCVAKLISAICFGDWHPDDDGSLLDDTSCVVIRYRIFITSSLWQDNHIGQHHMVVAQWCGL